MVKHGIPRESPKFEAMQKAKGMPRHFVALEQERKRQEEEQRRRETSDPGASTKGGGKYGKVQPPAKGQGKPYEKGWSSQSWSGWQQGGGGGSSSGSWQGWQGW